MIGFQNAKHRQMVHIKIQKRIVIPGHDELYQDTHTFNSFAKVWTDPILKTPLKLEIQCLAPLFHSRVDKLTLHQFLLQKQWSLLQTDQEFIETHSHLFLYNRKHTSLRYSHEIRQQCLHSLHIILRNWIY